MSHVFISYQREDRDFAFLLKTELDQAGFETWLDRRISAGESWITEIEQALSRAFALVVVLTPGALRSRYVTYEWAFALGRRIPVLPLLRQDIDLREHHERLEIIQHIDFRYDYRWDELIARLAEVREMVRLDAPGTDLPELYELLSRLFSQEEFERFTAIDELARLGRDVVPVLLRFTRSRSAWRREGAIMALGEIGDPRAVKSLKHALYDEQWTVRHAAAEALERIASPDAVYAIQEWEKTHYSTRPRDMDVG